MGQIIFGVQNQILRPQADGPYFCNYELMPQVEQLTRLFSLAQILGQGYPGA